MLNPAYKAATLLSVGMPPQHPDVVCLSFNVSPDAVVAGAVRMRCTPDEAERTALALLNAVAIQRYRDAVCQLQSDSSSGNASADGSPQSGQAEWPAAKSSSAPCADVNGASKQSSSSHNIQPSGA